MAPYDDRQFLSALENGLSYTDSATARHRGDCAHLPQLKLILGSGESGITASLMNSRYPSMVQFNIELTYLKGTHPIPTPGTNHSCASNSYTARLHEARTRLREIDQEPSETRRLTNHLDSNGSACWEGVSIWLIPEKITYLLAYGVVNGILLLSIHAELRREELWRISIYQLR
ncbi:hypothetical protein K449DRAFT_430253 [Hypoxylon sp. EC38]|nr:hypothetical protein K449DRAFT_430253 [Hypoxylon sp. EC38]